MSKVYVVDDDAVRRAQICRLLSSLDIHPEPFESIEEFFQFMPTRGYVLFHDRDERIQALLEGLECETWLPVIAYCASPEPERIVAAMQSGVASYVSYPLQAEAFRREYDKLDRALAGKFAKLKRAAMARKKLELLSRREREILCCMLDHGTSKAIARHLGISPRTVEAHRANLMVRLDVRTAAQAIRIAVEGDAFGMSVEAMPRQDEPTLGIACDDRYEELVEEAPHNRVAA